MILLIVLSASLEAIKIHMARAKVSVTAYPGYTNSEYATVKTSIKTHICDQLCSELFRYLVVIFVFFDTIYRFIRLPVITGILNTDMQHYRQA